MRRSKLALLSLVFIAASVIVPIALMLADTLFLSDHGWENWRGLAADRNLHISAFTTLAVAGFACALAALIAIPLAWVAASTYPAVRVAIQLAGLVPLAMPPFLSAAAISPLVPSSGIENLIPEILGYRLNADLVVLSVIYAIHFFPLIVLALIHGLLQIGRPMVESGEALGMGPFALARRIVLPLATPAFVLGAGIMFLRIIEDVGTPLVMHVESMLAPQLFIRLADAGPADPQLLAGALLLFAIAIILTLLAWRALLPKPLPTSISAYPVDDQPRRGFLTAVLSVPALALIFVLASLPLLSLSTLLGWPTTPLPGWSVVLQHAEPFSLWPTLLFAAACGLLLMLIASFQATVNQRQGRITTTVRAVTTALFAVPSVVLALALLPMRDPLSYRMTEFGVGGGWLLLMLVVVAKQMPYAQHLLARWRFALKEEQLSLARCHGMSSPVIFFRIVTPAFFGLFAALFLLGFAAASWELSAALMLLDGTTLPVAMEIFNGIGAGSEKLLTGSKGLLLTGLGILAVIPAAVLLYKPRRYRTALIKRETA